MVSAFQRYMACCIAACALLFLLAGCDVFDTAITKEEQVIILSRQLTPAHLTYECAWDKNVGDFNFQWIRVPDMYSVKLAGQYATIVMTGDRDSRAGHLYANTKENQHGWVYFVADYKAQHLTASNFLDFSATHP